MAIKWIQRQWDEDGRDTQEREETIERYVLEMTEDTDGKKEIRDEVSRPTFGFPALTPYSAHPDNDALQKLYVSQFQATRQGMTNTWVLEVTYSDEVDLPENPLKLPMEWEIDTEVEEEPSFRDADGTPYMTTAGSLIEATNDAPHIILSGNRAIATKWPAWLLNYGGAVNSDEVTIKGITWPVKTLKITKLKIGIETEARSGDSYCPFSIEIAYNQNDWTFRTPNRDFYQLTPKKIAGQGVLKTAVINRKAAKPNYDRTKIHVKNEHGVPEEPTEPQMIDRNGLLIPIPTEKNIVILQFNRNKLLPFSALPLK